MHTKSTFLHYLALLLLVWLAAVSAQARSFIRYKLKRNASDTYQVYMSSSQSFTAATMGTVQVTVLIPSGTLPEIPQGTAANNYLGICPAKHPAHRKLHRTPTLAITTVHSPQRICALAHDVNRQCNGGHSRED